MPKKTTPCGNKNRPTTFQFPFSNIVYGRRPNASPSANERRRRRNASKDPILPSFPPSPTKPPHRRGTVRGVGRYSSSTSDGIPGRSAPDNPAESDGEPVATYPVSTARMTSADSPQVSSYLALTPGAIFRIVTNCNKRSGKPFRFNTTLKRRLHSAEERISERIV